MRWAVYGVIAAASLVGCITIPPLGGVGWTLLVILYLMAHRQERLEARIEELEDIADDDTHDRHDHFGPHD